MMRITLVPIVTNLVVIVPELLKTNVLDVVENYYYIMVNVNYLHVHPDTMLNSLMPKMPVNHVTPLVPNVPTVLITLVLIVTLLTLVFTYTTVNVFLHVHQHSSMVKDLVNLVTKPVVLVLSMLQDVLLVATELTYTMDHVSTLAQMVTILKLLIILVLNVTILVLLVVMNLLAIVLLVDTQDSYITEDVLKNVNMVCMEI